MPVVFIHGVPDTHIVWDKVRAQIPNDDAVALDLPGFSTPVPDGFTATKEEYVDWIIARLEQLGEPVDLVGHDWGCILTVRVASLRPDLLRTWAAGDAPIDIDYEWHPHAKIWQTPGAGEKWMAAAGAAEWTAGLIAAGVPPTSAAETASYVDDKMKDCILRLYRSAVNVGREWEPDLKRITSPGLVFWGTEDPYCPIEFGRRLASNAGARFVDIQAGHWVQQQNPRIVANALIEHWRMER